MSKSFSTDERKGAKVLSKKTKKPSANACDNQLAAGGPGLEQSPRNRCYLDLLTENGRSCCIRMLICLTRRNINSG